MDLAEPTATTEKLDLASYIRAARFGEWLYERTELPADEHATTTWYVRRVTAGRVSEGILATRDLPPLARYMGGGLATAATRPADDHHRDDLLPRLPSRERPYLFELDEPLEPVPLELAHTNPIESGTLLRYCNRNGRLEATGTLTRRVEVQGLQEVQCPAGLFPDCLRVRIALEVRFPFGPEIDWESYVWLSREAGEVRRIEQFSGAFWLFGFGSAHEFRLVQYDRDAVQSQPAPLSPRWARGLVTFDRGIPWPRISGVIVDFTESERRPSGGTAAIDRPYDGAAPAGRR